MPSQSNPTPFFTRMKTPTDVPTFPQGQQGPSTLPSGPHSSQVIAKVSEEGELRYFCSICNADYAQRQGTWRHLRTIHYPKKQCSRCDFKWVRPYDCRDHFKKKHPGVVPDVGKAPGPRRKATIFSEHLPPQSPVSLPAVDQLRENWTESQPNPSASPFPTVSPPAVSFVNDNSQPAELMNDMDIYVQNDQFRSTTGSTATHNSSNLETAPIPTLFFPSVGVCYGFIVPEDRTVEPPGSSDDADEDRDIELIIDLLLEAELPITNFNFGR